MDKRLEEARDLAHKYQFLLLEKLVVDTTNEQREPTYSEKESTFRKMEAKFDDVLHGRISKEEKEFLESLPHISNWNENKPTIDVINNSIYFRDSLSESDKVVNEALSFFEKEKRNEAKELLSEILRLQILKLGKEEAIKNFREQHCKE